MSEPGTAFGVRQCRQDDLSSVLSLWEAAGEGVELGASDTWEDIQHMLATRAELFLVAEQGGQMVGAVMGGWDGRRAYVYHLVVTPPWRRRGVGNALMDELERRFRHLGAEKIKCQVFRSAEGSLAFWRSRGYEIEDMLHPLGKYLV